MQENKNRLIEQVHIGDYDYVIYLRFGVFYLLRDGRPLAGYKTEPDEILVRGTLYDCRVKLAEIEKEKEKELQ